MNVDRSGAATVVDPLNPAEPPVLAKIPAYRFLRPPKGPDEIGRLGDYRVLELLGQGGMAYVFLAEDSRLLRRVALKVMKPSLECDLSACQRFLREARVLASIKHEHLVTVHQAAQDEGTVFLAMEWLKGQTLEHRVADNGPPTACETVRLARETAAGLDAIHRNGLIHRDLKPNNIWVEEPGGRVKLLDLGLARSIQDDEGFTASGIIVGTPAFMSPEQARGERLDARSDLFSLGGVLYYLCSGRLPFMAATHIGTLTSVVLDHPPPIGELNPSLPRALAGLIMQLLEKKVEHRPVSAQEIIERLAAMEQSPNSIDPASTQPIIAKTIARESKRQTSRIVALRLPDDQGQEKKRLKRSIAVGLALVVGLSIAAGLAWPNKPTPGVGAANANPKTSVAEAPGEPPKPKGVLVLDDCDPLTLGKEQYEDSLTLLDPAGNATFRAPGFNMSAAISSSRMVAADSRRDCIWALENAGQRIRRLNLTGSVTLTIDNVEGTAIAVDLETGNVWALVGKGWLGTGKTVVYDQQGKRIATHSVSGWDIAYDGKAKAFWIASPKIIKISASSGEVLHSAQLSGWTASSVDVDPNSGAAWVAVRPLVKTADNANLLLKFDANCQQLASIDLIKRIPFKTSVDRTDGSVWVAYLSNSVEHFSAEGKSVAEHKVAALAVQADPEGGAVWVVTPDEIQKMTANGEVTKRVRHAGRTDAAWVALLD
jgi:serine/threonine protein kinase